MHRLPAPDVCVNAEHAAEDCLHSITVVGRKRDIYASDGWYGITFFHRKEGFVL